MTLVIHTIIIIGVKFPRFAFKGIYHKEFKEHAQRGDLTLDTGSIRDGGVFLY